MNVPRANEFITRAGIIAAGQGERLRGYSRQPKPLTLVGGRTLIERSLSSMAGAGARDVVVIINSAGTKVRDLVDNMTWPFRLRWIVETTPSSMHSFLRVVETLAENGGSGPFLVSTVDTIAAAGTSEQVLAYARSQEIADVVLGVSERPIGDEKPLLVRFNAETFRVQALGNDAAPSDYATMGSYAVRSTILSAADSARKSGVNALRDFFAELFKAGYNIHALPVDRAVDVDKPNDICEAEAFLRQVGE